MENFEQKYNRALDMAKQCYSQVSETMQENLACIFPELTESEDEKMADMVLKALDAPDAQSCIESWGINPKDVKNWFIAYLEKQKDYCGKTLIRDNGESACSYIERCLTPEMRKVWYEACAEIKEKQKEQPELYDMGRWDEESYNNGIHHVIQNPEVYGLTKQKEQLPVRYLPKQKVFNIMNKLTNLSYSEHIPIDSEEYVKIHEITSDVNSLLDYPIEQKPADKDASEPTPKQDYSKLNDLERAIHRGFLCAGVENVPVEIIKETAQDCITHIEHKPAEWSGVNDLVFRDICKHLKEEGYGGWVVLLETLRDGKFQVKQEWSEEDERILKGIIGKIDHDQTYGVSKLEMLSFLEKLRPQPKQEWSEEDERNFYWISTTIQERHLTPEYTQQVHKILSWLKSLRPSWKPSEEQMRELHCALTPGNPFDCDVLNGLYEQLKKL